MTLKKEAIVYLKYCCVFVFRHERLGNEFGPPCSYIIKAGINSQDVGSRLAGWAVFPAMVGKFLFPTMSRPALGQAVYQVVLIMTFLGLQCLEWLVLRLTYMSAICHYEVVLKHREC
jgi:hypothetical protein